MTLSFESWVAIVGLIVSGTGAWFTGWQIYSSKKIARGEFLLHLDEMFQAHNEVHTFLRPGGKWSNSKGGPSTVEDWVAIERYMGLFERIEILIESKILDIDTIDRLYGYRILNIVRNEIINQEKLQEEAKSWSDFIEIHNRTLQVRKNRSKWWYKLLKFLRFK